MVKYIGNMHKRNVFANSFYISGLFLLFAIIFLSIFFNKISRDSLVEQVQHRQQLSVRMSVKLIENLINSVGKSLLILSDNPRQNELDQFVKTWSPSGIAGITVLNNDGVVIKASNTTNILDLGMNLSDRDYYKWAVDDKDQEFRAFTPIVSRRGPSKGTYVVPVAHPFFSENKVNGLFVIGIPLNNLNIDCLENIKILDSSKVFLITSEGQIIYSEYPELISKNIKDGFEIDFLGKKKVIELILNDLKKDDESKLKLAIPNFENNFKLESYLISSAPIHISNELWKVVVATPEKDLLTFTYNYFNKQIIAVFIVVIIFILLTLRASRNSGYREAVVNEHRIHKISDQNITLK